MTLNVCSTSRSLKVKNWETNLVQIHAHIAWTYALNAKLSFSSINIFSNIAVRYWSVESKLWSSLSLNNGKLAASIFVMQRDLPFEWAYSLCIAAVGVFVITGWTTGWLKLNEIRDRNNSVDDNDDADCTNQILPFTVVAVVDADVW